MWKIPTDLKMLRCIYRMYYRDFVAFSEENRTRSSRIFVPIDVEKVAEKLGVDMDIVFGRLYYHMEEKFGYKQDDGVRVSFFSMRIGRDRHCVNFPYLASVLADLMDQSNRFKIATGIAALSLVLSVISIVISLQG